MKKHVNRSARRQSRRRALRRNRREKKTLLSMYRLVFQGMVFRSVSQQVNYNRQWVRAVIGVRSFCNPAFSTCEGSRAVRRLSVPTKVMRVRQYGDLKTDKERLDFEKSLSLPEWLHILRVLRIAGNYAAYLKGRGKDVKNYERISET